MLLVTQRVTILYLPLQRLLSDVLIAILTNNAAKLLNLKRLVVCSKVANFNDFKLKQIDFVRLKFLFKPVQFPINSARYNIKP